MILYSLACRAPECGHAFDSWFSSSSDYDRLERSGFLSCPSCGSADVAKALMAPSVSRRSEVATVPPPDERAALRALRRRIESESRDAGAGFADEARRIHSGDAPECSIYGTATPDEMSRLEDEGISFAQIPWIPLEDA